ncbi:MAG: OmpA family protein [Candidatus Omnitrophota bacterium]|nr:MAG: OmpA family protein [Candidatus Omnitrophota bacterium]
MKRSTTPFILLVLTIFLVNGCAFVVQKGRRSDLEKIYSLRSELDELSRARGVLERRLSKEIRDEQVRLKMAEKGLVIAFVAEILFDSGKAMLRSESYPALSKVARILKEEVPQNRIGIEGHTDNVPIKRSRWKSNWELSAHRALSVLHYLEENGVGAGRLSAIGYGEHHPVASNNTKQGKQLNRRVEIVILPKRGVARVDKERLEEENFEFEEELK